MPAGVYLPFVLIHISVELLESENVYRSQLIGVHGWKLSRWSFLEAETPIPFAY